jgi:hypothetical protein
MKQRIAEGGDVARSVLRELFPSAIALEPDDSEKHLWAVFVDDFDATRISLLYDTKDERLDANALATLAAFSKNRVENNGRGATSFIAIAPLRFRQLRRAFVTAQ